MRISKLILTAGVALSTVLASEAAVVSWSAEQIADSGTDQISNNGTLLEALNLGNTATVDVSLGGVTFTKGIYANHFAAALYLGTALGAAGGPLGGVYATGQNAAYTDLLTSYRYTATADSSLSIANLTIGQAYEIQFFVADCRDSAGIVDRCVVLDGVTYGTTGLISADGEGSGTIVTGTFTADAATQDFIMNIYDPSAASSTGWTINAYQIRAVPEPASATLMLLSGTAVFLFRRTRG